MRVAVIILVLYRGCPAWWVWCALPFAFVFAMLSSLAALFVLVPPKQKKEVMRSPKAVHPVLISAH